MESFVYLTNFFNKDAETWDGDADYVSIQGLQKVGILYSLSMDIRNFD